jgi:hypothetical protein
MSITMNRGNYTQQLTDRHRGIVLGERIAPGDPPELALSLDLFHQAMDEEATASPD